MAVTSGEQLSELSENFGQSTTLHGIRGVFDTSYHTIQRVVWLILVTSGLTVYIYLVSQSISRFLQYESVTKVSTITADSMDFPAVTICDSSTAPLSTMQGFEPAVTGCFVQGILMYGVPINSTCAQVLTSPTLVDVLVTNRRKFFHETFIACSFNQVISFCIVTLMLYLIKGLTLKKYIQN